MLVPPTRIAAQAISASPTARRLVTGVPRKKNASIAVHSGNMPGIKTEACAAGAKKNPLYAKHE